MNFEQDLIEFFKTHFEDNLNLGVALLQESKFIYINKRMHKIAGYSNKDTSNWTFNDYLSCIYEQDRSKVITQIRKKLTDSKDAITQYRIRLINSFGKIIWVNLYSKKITYLDKPTLFITLNPISKNNVDHTFKKNTIEIDLPEEKYERYNKLGKIYKILNKCLKKDLQKTSVNFIEDALEEFKSLIGSD